MSDTEVHIEAWQAAGLIDAPLAARLRAWVDPPTVESSPAQPGRLPSWIPVEPTGRPTSAGSFFGPGLAIGELFAYLGAAFVLGAWIAFLTSFGDSQDREALIGGGLAVAALTLFGLSYVLRGGDGHRRRAAGVTFAVTTVLAAGCAAYVVQLDFLRNTFQDQAPPVLIAAVALIVALVLRRILPAALTQFTLVVSIAGLAGAILSWLTELVYQQDFGGGSAVFNPAPQAPEPVGILFAGAAWWLVVALGLGLLALHEARTADVDASAPRRAAVTRFLAGLVAVVGTEAALTQTGDLGDFNYGRLLEPWVADVIILAVAIVLLQRAIVRDATSFVLAGALGLIVALTDFNYSYLASSTYLGLLVEGVILLGVGFAGERMRRVVAHSHSLDVASPPSG
ncbi:MAG: hypothetical protein ACRDGI_00735 [Candidatus Limnocylindrales bacterium]